MSLEALLAYCRDHDLRGSYRVRKEEMGYRAYIRVGERSTNGIDATRQGALDRIAAGMLDDLMDPMPTPGTPAYVDWMARRDKKGRR